jgi:PadR family transcriptional regulator, regulatory protein PadR
MQNESNVEHQDGTLSGLKLELRRGVVVLAVLSQTQSPAYGYSLAQQLAEGGLPIEEGTLYPLLRRLEKQGLLESRWETGASHPRKYYQISPTGQSVLSALTADWTETARVMHTLLKPAPSAEKSGVDHDSSD